MLKAIPNYQRGFSLIELMISLVIGMIVLLAVSALFTSSRQNHTAQDETAKFQENIRLGTELITRTLKHTGHRAPNLTQAPSAGAILTPGNLIEPALEGTEGGGWTIGNQDTLTVRFQGNGLVGAGGIASGMITDCAGNGIGTLPAPGSAVSPISFNRFSVATVDGRPWLVCETGIRTNGAGDPAVAATPLIPDVEGMEVLYGESFDNTANVSRYVSLLNAPNFERVVALRVFLLFRTEQETSPIANNQTYMLGDRVYGPFTDRRVRRVVEVSAGLRNWMP